MQDPATFLNRFDLRVPCVVDPTRVARVESEDAIILNWEVFFFCDEAAKERFRAEPLRWCGALTDPVTLQRFVPEDSSPRLEHGRRTYYFGSPDTRDAFVEDPDRFVIVPAYMLGETRADVEERERKRREAEREKAAREGQTEG